MDIINQFANREINAIKACLMLEAEGLKVPDVMHQYFKAEINAAMFEPFNIDNVFDGGPPPPLPRS